MNGTTEKYPAWNELHESPTGGQVQVHDPELAHETDPRNMRVYGCSTMAKVSPFQAGYAGSIPVTRVTSIVQRGDGSRHFFLTVMTVVLTKTLLPILYSIFNEQKPLCRKMQHSKV